MKTATALASPTDLANDLKRASTRPASVELTPRSTETVNCYLCGSSERTELLLAEDDLTGRSGRFRFVTCAQCGLAYQNPRLTLESVAEFYDDSYIAHRKRRDWGLLTPIFNRAMGKLDIAKDRLVARYCPLTQVTAVLDVGCGSGSFLQRLRHRYGVQATGLDFKDLSSSPFLQGTEFHHGLFYDVDFRGARFDVVTMWHFLEHDYDPLRSLRTARGLLRPGGRLIVEVPRLDSRTFAWFGRSLARAAGATAHGALRSGAPRSRWCMRPASRSSTTCRTARFPPTSTCSPASRSTCSEAAA